MDGRSGTDAIKCHLIQWINLSAKYQEIGIARQQQTLSLLALSSRKGTNKLALTLQMRPFNMHGMDEL
eukprot:1156254-Pelagomonas_calceolata.AAC.2